MWKQTCSSRRSVRKGTWMCSSVVWAVVLSCSLFAEGNSFHILTLVYEVSSLRTQSKILRCSTSLNRAHPWPPSNQSQATLNTLEKIPITVSGWVSHVWVHWGLCFVLCTTWRIWDHIPCTRPLSILGVVHNFHPWGSSNFLLRVQDDRFFVCVSTIASRPKFTQGHDVTSLSNMSLIPKDSKYRTRYNHHKLAPNMYCLLFIRRKRCTSQYYCLLWTILTSVFIMNNTWFRSQSIFTWRINSSGTPNHPDLRCSHIILVMVQA